ncbi:T9SS type A sorting domain-containing protein [Pedobacter glucosidilyticus]|uniref:T9SS type A sorting domain-containing protein n=1 Tax=Pedobacter glucosidilyticus TaxID=1122941 RepID=UPI0026F2C695|nr:T9SS type A sorting domain-containing protein [Pedobacter glucosidilyticus]
MKKNLLLMFLIGLVCGVHAQPWTYDFATATGTTTATLTSNSSSTFLPKPVTNNNDVIARLRHVGNPLGYFEMVNSGASFISGSALRTYSAGSGSGTKFSIYGIPSRSRYFDLAFDFQVISGATGNFFVCVGADGVSPSLTDNFFNDNSTADIADTVFTYVRLNFGSPNHAFRIGNYPSGGGSLVQTTLSTSLNPSISAINNSTAGRLRLLCNASNNSVQYTIAGTNYTITPRSYHIWFGNNQLLSAADNPNFGQANPDFPALNRLNAFAIFSNGTTDNANFIVDNFAYNNTLPSLVVLPVSLTSFTAKKSNNQIQLAWSTASESQNSHFEIERSVNGTDFVKIGERKGAGNSSSVLNYSFLDNNPANGTNYYRLKQVDFNGKFEYSNIEAASLASTEELALKYLTDKDNSQVKFEINTQKSANGSLVIYDLSGRRVAKQDLLLKQGSNLVSLSMLNLNSGIYFAACQVDGKVVSQKFVR